MKSANGSCDTYGLCPNATALNQGKVRKMIGEIKTSQFIDSGVARVSFEVPCDDWRLLQRSRVWKCIEEAVTGGEGVKEVMERSTRKVDIIAEVDDTIQTICKKVKSDDVTPGEYAATVAALAGLVAARSPLD